jgi:hypothetical protein
VFETFLQTSSANNSTAAGAKWYGMLPNLTGEANSPMPDDVHADTQPDDR